MKPVVTWILLANARTARIVQNLGPGKGISALEDAHLQAPALNEYSDQPGSVHNSATQSISGVKRRDPKDLAERVFAETILQYLDNGVQHSKFDQLIITAAPHLLGELRAKMSDRLRGLVCAEIDRDLTQVAISELPEHLSDVIAA
jgi:protein required for attachment to host cells